MTVTDYHNGHISTPEVRRFMDRLLCYKKLHYHARGAPDTGKPYMMPTLTWVKNTGVVPIFPGGPGVRGALFPHNKIMLLFQDFDTVTNYEEAVKNGYKPGVDGTTKVAGKVLEDAGVDLNDCYFTNRFVGVRQAPNQFGANPGYWPLTRRYAPYVEMSNAVLAMQIEEQKPKLIILYGVWVGKSFGLEHLWKDTFIENTNVFGHRTTVLSLIHTSLRGTNLKNVRYDGFEGHEAEIALIRKATRAADLFLLPSRKT